MPQRRLIPTGTSIGNGKVEGGLILPYSVELADGIDLGLMAEFNAVHDGAKAFDLEFLHSAALGFEITDRLGLFAEYVGIVGPGAYQVYGAGGMSFSLPADLIFDFGVQVGLNDAADDLGVFGGLTQRF